jgi:hypothetical protein
MTVVEPGATENFLYDSNGRRVEKSVVGGASTVYVYDAFGVMAAPKPLESGVQPRCKAVARSAHRWG